MENGDTSTTVAEIARAATTPVTGREPVYSSSMDSGMIAASSAVEDAKAEVTPIT